MTTEAKTEQPNLDFSESEQLVSWTDFSTFWLKTALFSYDYIFRGQSHCWPLTTTICRYCKLMIMPECKEDNCMARGYITGVLPDLRKELLAFDLPEFNYDKSVYDNLKINIKNHVLLFGLATKCGCLREEMLDNVVPDLSETARQTKDENFARDAALMSYLQHHGAPTPLLDWTYSPFVAAYFAVASSKLETKHIYIYVFNKPHYSDVYKDDENLKIVGLPTTNRPQMMQQGLFMYSQIQDIERYLADKACIKKYKIEISSFRRFNILRCLKAMNICEQTLFATPASLARDRIFEKINFHPELRLAINKILSSKQISDPANPPGEAKRE